MPQSNLAKMWRKHVSNSLNWIRDWQVCFNDAIVLQQNSYKCPSHMRATFWQMGHPLICLSLGSQRGSELVYEYEVKNIWDPTSSYCTYCVFKMPTSTQLPRVSLYTKYHCPFVWFMPPRHVNQRADLCFPWNFTRWSSKSNKSMLTLRFIVLSQGLTILPL